MFDKYRQHMIQFSKIIRKEQDILSCKGEKMDNQQPVYQQPVYQQPVYQQPMRFFRAQRTDRSLLSYILLSFFTCGIYNIVFYSDIADDINFIASPRDGQKTMHFCLMYFILSPLTCGVYQMVWFHQFSQRIGDEARARGISTSFGAGSFWLWYVLGLFFLVGPFIYIHQLCATMNMISDDYNRRGF
jgi:hypothetical protein